MISNFMPYLDGSKGNKYPGELLFDSKGTYTLSTDTPNRVNTSKAHNR